MPAINSENADAWRDIAARISEQRPDVGRIVTVTRGKHKGKRGKVTRHMLDKYSDAFRYASEAQATLREMAGRAGFVCLVRFDDGTDGWVKADAVDVTGNGR